MSMNSQGRSTSPIAAKDIDRPTVSGNKGLSQAEKLIFEVGTPRRTGVDIEEPKGTANRLGGHERTAEIGLPGLAEPETMRHYVRLSQKNYAIDLGVCTVGRFWHEHATFMGVTISVKTCADRHHAAKFAVCSRFGGQCDS